MHPFPIPVVGLTPTIGPGSQQEDETLNYLTMPEGMSTYRAPILPEPEELQGRGEASAWLGRLLELTRNWRPGMGGLSLDMTGLPEVDRVLIDQMLGEGEVSAQVTGESGTLAIQESVFAGVWRLRGTDLDGMPVDRVEVGDIPVAVVLAGLAGQAAPASIPVAPGVVNSPALLAEVVEQLQVRNNEPHVINLSLLPFGPEDADWLDKCLGRGRVALLSRGYGNCRVTATGVARVWWVQYFNSQDALILNTLEIVDVPEVTRAAAEDLADSAERLVEVIAWFGC